ncbi:MAG: dienelactone hydrolase family protein [Porticoccaceae bacterium]
MIQKAMVDIKTADGTMPAHWMLPAGPGPFPGVIVLMEAFGLVKHIEEVSERLAGEGYAVLAPDLYYRQLPDNKTGYDELPKAIGLMQKVDDKKFIEDMQAAFAFLEQSGKVRAHKVGVTGFCMGGRLTFLTAAALPDQVAAAAPFYGGGIANHLGQASAIKAPMLLFFADKDGFIPLDQVQAVDAKLKELGKDYRIKRYANADHGFFCNHRASYDEASAKDAWGELKTFLASHLAA